jgi:cysteine desulfurase/selenocysteine lyase
VYLDNAATTFPKPPAVVEAVRACLDQSLTVARSTHRGSFRGDEVLRRCRVKLARFFGASSPEEIIYTYSATDSLNMALNAMVQPGGHVLVSPLEHHSVMRPLHHMRRTRGITFEMLDGDAEGRIDPQQLRSVVRPETCLVVVNWISNVSGTVQPVAAVGAVASELGLRYLVDASQATGSHSVDVQAIGCDAMAQPAHKALFSLPGLGVLYLRSGFMAEPWRIGGTGYRSELVEQPEERPMRFESGTPNVPAIAGLDAALDWFAKVGVDAVERHCDALTAQLLDGLGNVDKVATVGPGAHAGRGGVVSFTVDGGAGPVDPLIFAQALSEHYGISSRAGLHCAPTAHRHFGTYERGGTVRLSVGYFNTADDIEFALEAVRAVAAELSELQ